MGRQARGRARSRRRKRRRTDPLTVLALCAMAIAFSAAFGVWQFSTAPGGEISRAQPAAASVAAPSVSAPPTPSAAPAGDEGDWRLLLVNKWTPIPDGYPLVPEGTVALSNGEQVDSRGYPDLQAMFDAMRAEGIWPVVASGYRTHAVQQQFWDDKVAAFMAEGRTRADAEAATADWVAKPGYSEHELGLAVDINGDGAHSDNTAVYDGWPRTGIGMDLSTAIRPIKLS